MRKMFRRLSVSAHIVSVVSLTAMIFQIGGATYITVVSRDFTNAESGNPYFECYPDLSTPHADVTTGRYVITRNIGSQPAPENPPPPNPEVIPSEYPTIFIYRTELKALQPVGYGSYGVFYCASSVAGDRTVIATIFLRSDAYYVPSGRRFTQTVNTGEVNVIIQFDRIHQSSQINNLWRFNGTGGYIVKSPDITYTVPSPIQASDEGIYEVHVYTKRHEARGGLSRLIIRECPMGRYNTSGCLQICPSCYNGGICDDEAGRCICAPGFTGDSCEEGCGGNRFGKSCEYKCNATNPGDLTACRGIQMCLPDPYGCSCAPGFKGLDCTFDCDVGEFGASCTEKCQCASGECNRFTGVCSGTSRECLPYWTGASCQECVDGKFGGSCSGTIIVENTPKNEGQHNIRFSCRRDGNETLSTVAVVALYRVSRDPEGSRMLSDVGITSIGSIQHESSITDFFEVDSVSQGGQFICVVHDVNSYRSAETRANVNILPRLSGPPVIRRTTTTSISLAWEEWTPGVHIGDPPLIGYMVYYKTEVSASSPWALAERVDSLAPAHTIAGLSPDSDYAFGVSAVREGEGGEGPMEIVTASTACLTPTAVLSHVRVHQVSSPEQLLLTWHIPTPNNANCRSGFVNISVYYSAGSPEMSVQLPANSPGSYYLTFLEPDSEYSIQVTLWNKDAEGPRSETSTGRTSQNSLSNNTSSALPWALFGVTITILIAIIVLIFLWKGFRQGKLSSPSVNNPKTIDAEETYENPTFESRPENSYESLKQPNQPNQQNQVDGNQTNNDYVNVK